MVAPSWARRSVTGPWRRSEPETFMPRLSRISAMPLMPMPPMPMKCACWEVANMEGEGSGEQTAVVSGQGSGGSDQDQAARSSQLGRRWVSSGQGPLLSTVYCPLFTVHCSLLRQCVVEVVEVLAVFDLDGEGAGDTFQLSGSGARHSDDGHFVSALVHGAGVLQCEAAMLSIECPGYEFDGDVTSNSLLRVT